MALPQSVSEESSDANLQQVPPLHGSRRFIGIEAKLGPRALIIQEQAVDEGWNEGAQGWLAFMPVLKFSALVIKQCGSCQ